MISEKEVNEIRKYLYTSENPIFFYDDDPDGLTSYLLLRRYCGKGKGVMINSAKKQLDTDFLKIVERYSPDRVFILDKPLVSQEFIDAINVPVIWIDHHPPQKRKGVKYYNPLLTQKETPPVARICYEIAQRDLWLSMIGCIADYHIPDFAKEFSKRYPDLFDPKIKDPGKAQSETQVGLLGRVYHFMLKGKSNDVKKYVNALLKITSPYEILKKETTTGAYIYKRYLKINKEYEELLEEVKKNIEKGPLLVYKYPTKKTSFSGTLSNNLQYLYPNKVIIIAREKGEDFTLSLRSRKHELPDALNKSMEGLDGYGGGHPHACGGKISKEDFPEFISRFKKELKIK